MKIGYTDAVIRVPMQLERYEAYEADDAGSSVLALWGHVGDYEVCIHMPLVTYQTPLDLIRQLAAMES